MNELIETLKGFLAEGMTLAEAKQVFCIRMALLRNDRELIDYIASLEDKPTTARPTNSGSSKLRTRNTTLVTLRIPNYIYDVLKNKSPKVRQLIISILEKSEEYKYA